MAISIYAWERAGPASELVEQMEQSTNEVISMSRIPTP